MYIYRKLYGMYGSQDEIAKAIGVSQKTVHTWSRGSYPSIVNARKISESLNISLGDVFDYWKTEAKKES